jgi:hypothetical protein
MAWALGALLVALALRSVPNAVVAVTTSFLWFIGFVSENEVAFLAYPGLVVIVLLPVCYWWRSNALFLLTVAAATAALICNAIVSAGSSTLAFFGFVLPIMALWCYGAVHVRDGSWPDFGAIARSLGALGLAGAAYVFSFHEAAEELACAVAKGTVVGEQVISLVWTGVPDYWIALAMPIVLIAAAAIAAGVGPRHGVPRMLAPVLTATAVLVAPFLPDPKISTTVVFNVVAVGLAGYGIVVGVMGYERRPYWAGLGLIVLLIVSRFFEYETELMIKAVGFMASGAVLIYAGIKFENRLKARPRMEDRT